MLELVLGLIQGEMYPVGLSFISFQMEVVIFYNCCVHFYS